MIKNLLDLNSKTKGYTEKMLILAEKINELNQKGIKTDLIFAHIEQYLNLFQPEKNLSENIQEINKINQEKENKKIAQLKKDGSEKISLFFKNNGLDYMLKSTSPNELVEIYKENKNPKKFQEGIDRQEEKLKIITKNFYDHIKYYHLDGDTIAQNFSLPVGFQESLKFGLKSEFVEEKDKSMIYVNLYTIQKKLPQGLFANEYSILMLCARFGMNEEIEYLVKKGCDVHYKNPEGKSALDVYCINKLASPEQISYIKSLLDGSYKNGFYVAEYEKNRFSTVTATPESKPKNKLKL